MRTNRPEPGKQVVCGCTIVVLGLALATAWLKPVMAAGDSEFLAIARQAVGGAGALARIHAVHLSADVALVPANASLFNRTRTVQTRNLWLEPPSRILETVVQERDDLGRDLDEMEPGPGRMANAAAAPLIRRGIDGSRVITTAADPELVGFMERRSLERFALAWLLYDPAALGITLADEGSATVDGKSVHVLSGMDASGFEIRLYFDPQSHRLVMSDDRSVRPTHADVIGRHTPPFLPPPAALGAAQLTTARYTYGDYRRVGDVWLPYTMTATQPDTQATRAGALLMMRVTHVELNPKGIDKQFR